MQDYSILQPTGLIKKDRAAINKNFQTVASNFSSNQFPTNSETLFAGMFCYRTDSNKLYMLMPDMVTWKMLVDFTTGVVYVPNSSSSDIADKAVKDNAGQNIVNTYVKSLSINGSTVTVTKGDGTTSSFVTPNTTYNTFTGASASAAGQVGLVPAPASGQTTRFLRSDGTWFDAGSGNIGSSTKPVYMANGKITASSSSVGSGTKPVYLSGGNVTASGSNVGGSNQMIYMSGGELKAGTNFGSMATTASKQPYREVYGISGANAYDKSSGTGNYVTYSLEVNTGLSAGTRSLQTILQELINRSHTHSISRKYSNCQCQCNCDCGDNDGG